MSGKSKSVWDCCSSVPMSLSGRINTAIGVIAEEKGINQSKVAQMLLLESKTLNDTLDSLENMGWVDKREKHET